MKTKAKIACQVIPMPNASDPDRYIVQTQYTDGGPIHTDSNDGKGYTLEQANARKATVKPR